MNEKELMVDNPSLFRIRHSLAHIMAQAVQKIRPGAKLGFGPPIEDGFYYDFILPEPISQKDFKSIEREMKKIIKQNQPFSKEDLPAEKAYKKIDQMGEPYKAEYAKELVGKNRLKTLSFYTNGSFVDMCEGPHVESSKEIPIDCFKLRSVAGAYWRGDSKNVMMSRVYAWAFENREELEKHVHRYNEGLKRDHKKLGAELNLFYLDEDIGKGLPLWLPAGTVIRQELEKYVQELEFKAGFVNVVSPHLARSSLYYKTGHLPYYKESMYPMMQVEGAEEGIKEEYVLKPMNCPHHHKIFASKIRSYRELPLRLAEYGVVYRYEDHGALSGILRVRSMCMNDGHIYCSEEQIQEEFLAVMDMHKDLYTKLGIKNYFMRFSTWDPDDPKGKEKFVNNPTAWEKTQDMVRRAMKESGTDFVEEAGEAAFYGPKIDFQLKTVTGREETASTNQLDFAVPPRLELSYVGADGKQHTPYVIHRAPAGTHERFIAFLIEHFGGAFPTWLAPIQVKIITVAEKFNTYGEQLLSDLKSELIRAELDFSGESLSKKIRTATKQKIPNLLIIGENEVQSQSITLRRYGIKDQKTLPFDAFKKRLLEEIKGRTLNEHVLL